MKKILSVLTLVLVAGSAFAAAFPEISRADLKKAIAAKDVVVIDVNGTDSFKSGHIPGAIDFVAVKENLATQLPADKNALVVAYCGSPACGAYAMAAEAAKDLGYTNVKHYSDGISGWKEAGESTEKAQ